MYYSVDEAYRDLGNILLSKEAKVSPRGLGTKELINVNLCITNPLDYLSPRTFLSYFYAEILWYRRATRKLDGIEEYAPFWKELADENGEVNSNYGVPFFN